MAGKRIIKPSISIGGTEFKCMSRSVTIEPGDIINFCEREWTCSIDVEISYGAGGSWTVLSGMEGTEQEIIISPSDGTISADNPSATFTAEIPPVPFMSGAERGERMTFSLDLTTDDPPVYATS